MATNLITQCPVVSRTYRGVTFAWNSAYQCSVSGTATNITWCDIVMDDISNTPFEPDHTYELKFSSTNVQFRGYFYPNTTWTGALSSFNVTSDHSFTIPSGTVGIILRLYVTSGTTANETVTPEMYDITYTDVDADCDMMMSVLGYPNSWFYPKWIQFASGAAWDGESCSEIACCISYMAGNLSKIYVSNYAQGLADLFRANGRFGSTPSRGAFIWFDYDGDGVPDHTGRVYEILSDGTIHTVEGNVGGVVVERYYQANTSYIYGYGYPNYDNDPTQVPSGPTGKFVFKPYWRHKRRERG